METAIGPTYPYLALSIRTPGSESRNFGTWGILNKYRRHCAYNGDTPPPDPRSSRLHPELSRAVLRARNGARTAEVRANKQITKSSTWWEWPPICACGALARERGTRRQRHPPPPCTRFLIRSTLTPRYPGAAMIASRTRARVITCVCEKPHDFQASEGVPPRSVPRSPRSGHLSTASGPRGVHPYGRGECWAARLTPEGSHASHEGQTRSSCDSACLGSSGTRIDGATEAPNSAVPSQLRADAPAFTPQDVVSTLQ